MSNLAFYSTMDKTTYSLVINSADKVSGTNNNANYNINFQNFLPQNYDKYKVIFSAQTACGYYKDPVGNASSYGSAKLLIDFNCRQYSYDTSKNSQSTVLGFLQRYGPTSAVTTASTVLSTFYCQYPPRCITRPITTNIHVKFINKQDNTPFVDTNSSGATTTDMTSYSIFLEFIRLEDSIRNPNSTI